MYWIILLINLLHIWFSPVKDTSVTNDCWCSNGYSCHHGDVYTCSDCYNPGEVLHLIGFISVPKQCVGHESATDGGNCCKRKNSILLCTKLFAIKFFRKIMFILWLIHWYNFLTYFFFKQKRGVKRDASFRGCSYLVYEFLSLYSNARWPFNSQDFINNSPYCLPYNLCDVSLENLELDWPIP